MKLDVIAIDGPAGAGKSTVAKLVAERLNFIYVDTGAMYRAVTSVVLEKGISPSDSVALDHLAENVSVRLEDSATGLKVFADGTDVTVRIRSKEVTRYVSTVSRNSSVRKAMVRLQCQMASSGKAVLDGRDIGTVVVTDAATKIFLIADIAERVRRRQNELAEAGRQVDFEQLRAEMIFRDEEDGAREISPLVPAKDAVFVDTTGMSIPEVVEKIISIRKEKLHAI